MKISKIGFYGIRNIGPGLVQTIAQKGLSVIVYEKNDDVYHNALNVIENNVDYEIEHWGMTRKDKKVLFSRIEHIDNFKDLENYDIDILIESVEENLENKKHAVNKIENELKLNIPIILTSQINKVSEIIEGKDIGKRIINIHPIPSVPPYKIVEFIKAEKTSDVTVLITQQFFEKLFLKHIEIPDSIAGVGPRIFVSVLLEICDLLQTHNLDFSLANKVMKEGLRMYKGPLSMADELGLDTVKMWIEEMSKKNPDVYKVPKILNSLVEKGFTGVKMKKGFLEYK